MADAEDAFEDDLSPFAFLGFDRDFFPQLAAPRGSPWSPQQQQFEVARGQHHHHHHHHEWPPTPRPRLRHNAGSRPVPPPPPPPASSLPHLQQRRRCRRRPLLDWPEEKDSRYLAPEEEENKDPSTLPAAVDDDCWSHRVSRLFMGEAEEDGLADVTFVVEEEGDELGEVRFKAHKFILALRSPVFRAMFFGPLAERSGEVRVPDVTPAAFRALLAFVYKDEPVEVLLQPQTPHAAWQLWYAAKKYLVEDLEEKCRKYLKSHLTPLNVLDTYAFAEQYGDQQVLYQCLRLIDQHARHILASSGFTNLPLEQAKNLVGRRTLNAREVDVFESVVRWIQAEIERRLHDEDEGNVQSLKETFNRDFRELIQFESLSSQDFVHHVLPQGVLETESICEISSRIRQQEIAAAATSSALESPMGSRNSGHTAAEQRLGLNQARDLLLFMENPEQQANSPSDSILRSGVVHTTGTDGGIVGAQRCLESPGRLPRFGPGYYQLSRFSPRHELALVWKWPREYSLKFRADRSIFLLGACVTETDRQFYSPKVKYFLKLKDAGGKVVAEGSETFIKKTSHRFEGGLPKALEYGPHDVSFRGVAHLNRDQWYELSLKISEEMWSVCPLLVCKCRDRLENFGVNFEFEPNYVFSRKGNNMESFKRDVLSCPVLSTDSLSGDEEEGGCDSGLSYGLISRLYFFY